MTEDTQLLALALAQKPASGATIKLIDSPPSEPMRRASTAVVIGTDIPYVYLSGPLGILYPGGVLFLSIYASHDSGASGVVAEVSDDGTNYVAIMDTSGGVFPKTYTATNLRTTYQIPIVGKHIKVNYTNSASTLTAFQLSMSASHRRPAY